MRIGIDIGGTNIGVGFVDDEGNILKETSFHTNKEKNFDEIIKDIFLHINKMRSGSTNQNIDSIGIGLPGIVNVEKGVLIFAPNLNVRNYNIKEKFITEYKVPIYIENDANCAAIAESKYGVTKEYKNSATITIGTGIGGGFIINGEIFRGSSFASGEVGHMVILSGGEQCNCGRRGCWEQYASSNALRKMTIKAAQESKNCTINRLAGWDENRISGRILFDALKQGDTMAKTVFDKYITYVTEGIANICNILNLEAIAIGGSISRQGDKLTEPIKEYLSKTIMSKTNFVPEILTAKFGREAGIIGASLLKK